MPFLPDMDMEYDPDGSTEQVAVVMRGKTYRDAGLSKSKFPNIEGPLYDKLCEFPRHKFRDEVRKIAMNLAILANETNFKPTIEWLDNFMRRFCISRKKSGSFYKKNFLKIKGSKSKTKGAAVMDKEEESLQENSHAVETNEETPKESSDEILALQLVDPLDLGEDITALKAPNGTSENSSSLLGDNCSNDEVSHTSDKTIVFDPISIKVPTEKDLENSIIDEKNCNNNNNDNGEIASDSDESIKEIPRGESPEKEIISLIDSDDEMALIREGMKREANVSLSHAESTEESKRNNNDSEKPKDDNKLEENIDKEAGKGNTENKTDKDVEKEKPEEKTSKESENGITEEKTGKEPDKEKPEEKTGKEPEKGKPEEKTGKESEKGKPEEKIGKESEKEKSEENTGKEPEKGKLEEKTGKESEKVKTNKEKEGEEEEEEDEEEEVIEIDDGDSNSDSDDSDSESDSEKSGDKNDDLVVKQRKSWEDMNYVDYSKKEEKYYTKNISTLQKKLDEKITQCTACFEQVNHTVKEDIFTHPILGVLVCKKCYRFYGKGDFNKDAEGYDEYCRWCANGGDLLLCDECTNGFCKKCVKRNLGRNAESEAINSKSWKCYVCDLSPLKDVRAFHRAVLDQLRSVSILKKTLSRRERKEFSIKQKFSALKMKRKSLGFTTPIATSSKEGSPPEFAKVMKEIHDLCYICVEQIDLIGTKTSKDMSDDAEVKCQRRLLRLAHHMEKSFNKIKTSLGETSGLNVEEILLNSSQRTDGNSGSSNKEESKKRKNSSHQNSGTSADSSKESPNKHADKKRKVSTGSKDGCKSPPPTQVVMETDEEMEIDQQESDKTTQDVNKNKDSEAKESSKDKDLLHTDSSNEGEEIGDTPFDDAASSKNPDGDTEKDETEDETVKTKTSPGKSKSSSQKSGPESDVEMSQSLLKDVQPTQNPESTSASKESKDKASSSDGSNSSKKGIIYRKSKRLKKRLNSKSEKELSNDTESSDEDISKNKKNKKTSNENKLKKKSVDESDSTDEEEEKVKKKAKEDNKLKRKLVEGSEDSSDDDEDKIKEAKAKEDSDSKENVKKSSKSENKLKSLLQSDSDSSDSDVEKIIKTSSARKLKLKKKKSNYKPKPKSVQEAVKAKQLKSDTSVKIEKLPKNIINKLEEGESICISDYPEIFGKDIDLGLESESDMELDAILKSKTEIKGKRKHSDDSENDADSEDNSQNEDEDDEDKDDSKEKKIEKPADKKRKKEEEKNGLLDINLDNEEGDNNDDDDDLDDDAEDTTTKKKLVDMQALLVSSEEEVEDENEEEAALDTSIDTLTPEELEKKKRELYEKNKEKLKDKMNNSSESENDEIVKKVKKKGFLSFKFSSSDEEEEDDEESEKEAPRKARMFIESDSDFEDPSKKKKKNDLTTELFTSSSESESEESSSSSDEKSKKDKKSKSRKRIKRPTSSTEDDEANENDLDTPKKRHRRIIRDEDLLQSTKDATQEEKERRDRVKERQLRYNKILEVDVETDQSDKKKLILDFDEKEKEELVKVNEKLVYHLKPHQHEGIKFMWDNTIESVERMEKGERGGGCILAHCMGLGKTLQVIAFIHTLLTSSKVNQKVYRVMVCCPVNTVYNWKAEFKQWLRGKLDTFEVIELASAKDLWARAYRLEDWYKEGGVCIIGYDMFRNLVNEKSKRNKGPLRDKFQKYLVNPGADLMVCDEGHILKNEKTALSIAINKIKTFRRIILTGTPLQNNLKEYHCMIQFVKPNLLGSKKEFMNRFVNPIEAGQCTDALKKDVSRMKKRAHILHNLLEGCVQRFDYTVLKPFLPPKYEYVVSVQMSKEQIKLYDYYIKNLAQGGPKRHGSGLFVDFTNLSRIWSHPVVLYRALVKWRDQEDDDEDEGGDLDGFIDDEDSESWVDSEEEEKRRKKKSKKKKPEKEEDVEIKIDEDKSKVDEPVEELDNSDTLPEGLTVDGKVKRDWYKKVVGEMCNEDLDEDAFFNRIEISGKLYLLFDILREASSIGDKVLLFSQSIMALDVIEEFLRMIDAREIRFPPEDKEDTASSIPQPFKHWINERDYYRLDGSTPAEVRKDMCKSFNNPTNERCRLFLISTRAGGVGINLVAANRVIIFDSSWNPSNDTQSIFRVYRFGQKKPCYIYRFVAQGTMEEKIYSRQVTKISTALRVVDEHQIKRHFDMAHLSELYQFTPSDPETRDIPTVPEDKLLAELLIRNRNWIVSYHEQESLLENQTSEELTEEERNAAWEDYENEKKGIVPQKNYPGGVNLANVMPSQGIAPFDIENIYKSVLKANPKATQAQLYESVYLATEQIQRVHITQFQNYQAVVYNMATNPMIVPELLRNSIFKDRKELIHNYEAQLRILESNIQSESNVMKQIGAVTNNRSIPPHSVKVAAGLARGNPSSSGISSTAQYVTRNIPNPNLVNTSLKPVYKQSSSNASVAAASTSNNSASGTAETASKSNDQVEITLE